VSARVKELVGKAKDRVGPGGQEKPLVATGNESKEKQATSGTVGNERAKRKRERQKAKASLAQTAEEEEGECGVAEETRTPEKAKATPLEMELKRSIEEKMHEIEQLNQELRREREARKRDEDAFKAKQMEAAAIIFDSMSATQVSGRLLAQAIEQHDRALEKVIEASRAAADA
jgi:hypothetical protein